MVPKPGSVKGVAAIGPVIRIIGISGAPCHPKVSGWSGAVATINGPGAVPTPQPLISRRAVAEFACPGVPADEHATSTSKRSN